MGDLYQPDQNLSGVFRQDSSPIIDQRHPDGPRPSDIVISGTGFGSGPNVVLYADFKTGVVDNTAQLTDALVGPFTSAHYATSLLPKYAQAFGRVGIQSREGGTDAATNNRLTGFLYSRAPVRNVFMAYDSCVPAGRHFPGASAPNTLPAVSSWKPFWVSDQALDQTGLADLVPGSWTTSSFNFLGNDSAFNIYMPSVYDFDGWTDVIAYTIAGNDPYLDDGEIYALMSSAEIGGAEIDQVTNLPVFQYRERYAVTAADSTLYRVTISGVNCDYTSGTGQAASVIAAGLRDAINAAAIPNVTATVPAGTSFVLTTAALNTVFTSSISGHLVKQTHAPQYTHFNFPAWQGNGSQNLSQSLHSYVYVAAGSDDSVKARVELLSSSSYASSVMHRAVLASSWSDTEVTVPPERLVSGATHVCVTNSSGVQTIVEIPEELRIP